ncbi:UDP-4-amino-4,6-dideoxy-N-acetyl-beta-L-altrosamine transaminase [Nitrincola alkalilacustris]|uniref:UDP-4-amino-4, 6-dideoxy-N-acetyl-beta-L-altrosamine transaminase n=1 Tax=Nitrincola alkalilacustris TaxID=1571224 RepID=UPI00124EDFE6|nr:UDP-4-amino-4,6-dideoxy-N-acetyl-beta-L-altrosamine transaminase [Nitrincola alkalilacustris]
MIPYGRQDIQQEDIDAVIKVLKSDLLTQGPAVQNFEQALANYCRVPHAVAVNSATSALHLACLALDLSEGDWLWTSPITFVASANCARYCGAQVDFVDIDPQTGNLCPKALETKLIKAEQEGKLPSIVIPVHLCGQPCDMAAIRALADKFSFRIIEDASHAIGAQYRGEPVGNCRYSDITVFSFHPVKIITTAEGGVATTRNSSLAKHMARLRSHGITRDPDEMTHEPDGAWYYQQIELGFNYRMTDLQAALGLSQLNRLDQYIQRRQQLATRYDQLLTDLPLSRLQQHSDSKSSWHLYVIRLQSDHQMAHREVFEAMRAAGIGVNLHYIPVHTQPYYQEMGFREGDYPAAEAYYREAITLPLHATLTDEDQTRVAETLSGILHP